MKPYLKLTFILVSLSACSGGAEQAPEPAAPPPPPPAAEPAPEPAKAPEPPAAPAAAAAPIDSIAACPFTAAVVSEALGAPYADGQEVPPIPGVPVKSCRYETKNGPTLRLNISPMAPALAAAVKADLGNGLAGEVAKLAGDADGAVFQMQKDVGSCALHYVRSDIKYEVRFMPCRDDAAKQQAKLMKLPRP